MRFQKGESFIFKPKDKYSPLKKFPIPNPDVGKKVKIHGPGDENYDYTIVVPGGNNAHRLKLCNEDELKRI